MGHMSGHIRSVSAVEGKRPHGARLLLLQVVCALALLVSPWLVSGAEALNIDLGKLHGWQVGYLKKEPPKIRSFWHALTGGAVAVINSATENGFPTIRVFESGYSGPRFGTSISAWKRYLLGGSAQKARNNTLFNERAFRAANQNRFFTEVREYQEHLAPPHILYGALLFIMTRHHLIELEFNTDDKKEFKEDAPKARGLYRKVEIHNIS